MPWMRSALDAKLRNAAVDCTKRWLSCFFEATEPPCSTVLLRK